MQSLAATEQDAPRARRVVRDSEYPWGNTTMMNLYSGTTDPFSHRCRIVLFEKGMDFQVIDVDLFNKPEDIAVINPYNRVPVLLIAISYSMSRTSSMSTSTSVSRTPS